MIITDKNYQNLSKKVYQIYPNHTDYTSSLKEWAIREFGETEFQILKIKENSTSDGLQAMTVAPFDETGHVDTAQVVIAYAGTNSSDFKDLETNLRTVGVFLIK